MVVVSVGGECIVNASFIIILSNGLEHKVRQNSFCNGGYVYICLSLGRDEFFGVILCCIREL